MNNIRFANAMIQLLILLPFCINLFTPLIDQTSFFWRKLLLSLAGTLAAVTVMALVCSLTSLDINLCLVLAIILLFVYYRRYSGLDLIRTAAVFTCVVTIFSYIYTTGYLLDALQFPGSSFPELHLHSAVIRLIMATAFAIAYYAVSPRSMTRLVTNEYLSDSHWFITIPVSACFLFMNCMMIPRNYEVLKNQAVLRVYVSYLLFSFSLFFLMCIVFRMFSTEFIESAKSREEQRFMAVQESEYLTLQQNIDQMRKFRHDLRHSAALLQEMADKNDIEGIKKYLQAYTSALPDQKMQNYCINGPVNAVLNYYAGQAAQQQIDPIIQVNLPAHLIIPDPSLCSMIGNVFENAIEGCQTLPPEQRRLSISALVDENHNFFLVTTNTFDGKVKVINGKYQSTKRQNGGVGTASISAIAEKFSGTVRYHHSDTEFFVDIMIPNCLPEETAPASESNDRPASSQR